ncbi:DUF1003 domain-containing protein [Candidatus Pacearchaeota archaeon]|nr:DUF1003 domain-containing protein [Candidatus Pacearchaeota archaeon]MBD3283560.1 DUF1003 domain-containing protein [Candidatus Pacearchaeota archaeon]
MKQKPKSGILQAGKKFEKLNFKRKNKNLKPFVQDSRKLTLSQKTADNLAKWAGSWSFILSFLVFLCLWMILNTYIWLNYINNQPFDPYPFILLNLILSCLAAIQAPVILMSQNRAAERDRLRAEYDYQVNRKAEREIRDIKKQVNRIELKLNEKLHIKRKTT